VYETARAASELGDTARATQLLQRFADAGAPNPRAALDLANVYVLKAKLAEKAGNLPLAKSLFDLAYKPLKANAQQTPANKAGVANLAFACQWASQSKIFAAEAAEYKQCVTDQRRVLAESGGLTPWWAKAFPAE
jgi:uncharacterized protein HemY